MRQNLNGFRRIVCVMLIALLMATVAMPAFAATRGDIFVVNQDHARLRAKPESGSDILDKLPKGRKVMFLKDYKGWWKLELSNGKTGYMYKTFLNPYVSAKVGKLYRSRLSGKLPVRTKPNSKSKVKFNVKNNSTLVLLERHGSWGLVRAVSSGKVGYVNIKYLKNYKKK